MKKPEKVTTVSLDLFDVLRYLSPKRPGIYDRVQEFYESYISQCSFFQICFDEIDQKYCGKELYDDLMLIKEEFEIENEMRFHILW